MSTCTIIIKIKDYFPKIDSIPYQNFVCLFTNGENEGQLPLISQENESYQHQIKNVVSDIKYKVHVLDYNDMSLIGMCDIIIPYNIISQITPPNGFIQEQQKKILMDVNTKRKLFGTVLNMGDIYLNIYSEIYLCDKKEPKKNITKNSRSTARKKNILSPNSYGLKKKKLDGSPRTVKKKKIIMQINSDRQAIMNLNKNNKNFLNKSHVDNNIKGDVNNTLFSTNITEQEFNGIDKNILEKGTELRNDFNLQLNSDKNEKESDTMQLNIKDNFIKLIDFYTLLSNKLFKLYQKNITLNKKSSIYKEKLFTELKKNNILTQKKTSTEIENFINVNLNEGLNEKFLRAIIKVKKSEFKIYQNIFNLFYYEYDILKWKEQEKNKKMEENVKIELLLVVFKNLIKNYGNISQIYNDKLKKDILKSCLNKYGISEKNENGESDNNNNNIISSNNNKDKNKSNVENKENKNDIDKFKVIKEVDEEKEDEIDDEEDKYSNNNRIHNNNTANQISYTSSNKKDSISMGLYSNEKLKSNNKNKSNLKSGQNLFDKEENKKNYDIVKANLNNKLDDSKKNEENNNNVLKNSAHKKEDINNKSNNEEDNKNDKEENAIINNIEEEKENILKEELKEEELIENKIENKKEEDKMVKEEKEENEKEENEEKEKKHIIEEEDHFTKEEEHIIEEEEKKVLNNKDENRNEVNENDKRNKDINEVITNNIDSEKEEIKSLRNEKKINEENKKEESKIINNNNRIYTKNRVRNEKKKKEIYDKEDLIMQKYLIEEFPKKCKEENKFIRLSKYEYSFGEEKIRVELGEDDVILKLDEGDYKLDEFIDILNEGKEEQDEEEHEENEKIEEVNEENNEECNSNRNERSEKKGRRKRRKRVSEESSEEEEKNDENKKVNKAENKMGRKYNHKNNYEEDDYGKENYDNNEMNEENIDNDKCDNNNSGNKNMNYMIKKRKDYILQK